MGDRFIGEFMVPGPAGARRGYVLAAPCPGEGETLRSVTAEGNAVLEGTDGGIRTQSLTELRFLELDGAAMDAAGPFFVPEDTGLDDIPWQESLAGLAQDQPVFVRVLGAW